MTTNRADVISVLRDITPEYDVDQLAGDADIRVELEIDSFDLQLYLEGLAQHSGLEVPETDYEQLVTIDGAVAYLQAKER